MMLRYLGINKERSFCVRQQVTLVTGFESSHQRPNIREIIASDVNFVDELPNLFNMSNAQLTWHLLPYMVSSCSKAFTSAEVQAVLKEEFDLAMMYIRMTECFLPLLHERKVN